MEPTRELDQIRAELNLLHDRTMALRVEISSSQAVTEQRFTEIMARFDGLTKGLDSMRQSINALEHLASEGRTSLKTLLWVGGAVAAITTFMVTLINYIPR